MNHANMLLFLLSDSRAYRGSGVGPRLLPNAGVREALDLYSPSMIFVFEVRVKEGWTAEAYADAWVRASEIIQRSPGSRGTRLHRNIGDPGHLLAIASWDSKSARDKALPSEEVRRIIASQAEFVDINVIGEFEDPDWVVEPDH
jgi:heme-degrading monooxygenase HmoA